MARIFWDTNLFIYLFEDYGKLSAMTASLRRRMIERGDELLTSSMTLAEVQVKPVRMGEAALARQYRDAIVQTSTVIAFDHQAVDSYVELRRQSQVKGADAIQLACAAAFGTEVFVTNDARLQSIRLPGIHFIVPLARVPL